MVDSTEAPVPIPIADSATAEMEAIMGEHEAGLLRYAARLLHDPASAQDVVQETFIKLFQGWHTGERPATGLKTWLYRVVHNAAVDFIRRESRLRLLHGQHTREQRLTGPEPRPPAPERRETLRLAMEQVRYLDPAEQQVLILRFQEGLSYKEISDVTKRTEGNVGCLLHHAVKNLSARMKQKGLL